MHENIWLDEYEKKKETIILKTTGDAIVSVLPSSAVDFGFEPKSGQIKDSKIDICCSEKDAALWNKNKD